MNLYPFQEQARQTIIDLFEVQKGAVLGLPTGGGKTVTSLSLVANPQEGYTLIIVPKSLVLKWGDELEKWGEVFKKYFGESYVPKVFVIDPTMTIKERMDFIRKNALPGNVIITNYATIQYIARYVASKKIVRKKEVTVYDWEKYFFRVIPEPEYVVVDEAHRMNNHKSVLTMAIREGVRGAKRILLTATPIDRRPSQFYPLFAYVSYHFEELFSTYNKFADQYENRGATRFSPYDFLSVKRNKIPELVSLYSGKGSIPMMMVSFAKEEILPFLPPIRYNLLKVRMTEKQERIYNEVKKKSLTRDETGKWVWIDNPTESHLRLTQIATVPSSAKKMSGVSTIFPLTSGKFDYILDVVQGSEAPVVIYAKYTEPLKNLETYLMSHIPSLRIVKITGAESTSKRKEAYEAINAGEADVCLLTDAGGEGIDLVGSNHIIFLMLPNTARNMTQIRDRLHRPGAEKHKSILVTILLSEGTVDEESYKTIKNGGIINAESVIATMNMEE